MQIWSQVGRRAGIALLLLWVAALGSAASAQSAKGHGRKLVLVPSSARRDLTQVPSLDEQGGQDRWAVVVGISKFKYARPNLSYPADDARAMANALETYCGFPRDHIKLLTNDEASAADIRTAIGSWLVKVAGRRDLVVIYFSGHGSGDLDANIAEDGIRKYLICYDADPSNLFTTAIPMDDLSSALLRIKSEQTVVLLDCCYSGSAEAAGHIGTFRTLSRPGVNIAGRIQSGFVDTLALSGRGRAVMTACDADEEAQEYDDLKHGIFTYYLIKGLAGEAVNPATGQVNVNSLYDYVTLKLHTPGTGRTPQTPLLSTSVRGELILAGRDIPHRAEGGSGSLKVTTSPLGAQVFVDNDPTPATTPLERTLSSGLHHLAIYKPGYLPVTDDVSVSSFRPALQSYVLNVEETKGDLLVIAADGSRVLLDGKAAGTVAAGGLIRLPNVQAASHVVRVEAAGSRPEEQTVDIQAGRPTVLSFTLQRELTGVRASTPADLPAGLSKNEDGYQWAKDESSMVFVSEGPFFMGSDDVPNAVPKHEVTLPAFWIDRTEVTNKQFARFVQESGYHVTGEWTPRSADRENRPVSQVTLADAKAYAAWAGKRLPSEAQWEKAARGPDGRLYPYGNELNVLAENIRAYGLKDALDVGSLSQGASPYGALDMLGNVWEWCDSPYAPYPGNSGPDASMNKNYSVIRGGSYLSPVLKDSLSVVTRAFLLPNLAQDDVGFRCVAPAPGGG